MDPASESQEQAILRRLLGTLYFRWATWVTRSLTGFAVSMKRSAESMIPSSPPNEFQVRLAMIRGYQPDFLRKRKAMVRIDRQRKTGSFSSTRLIASSYPIGSKSNKSRAKGLCTTTSVLSPSMRGRAIDDGMGVVSATQ